MDSTTKDTLAAIYAWLTSPKPPEFSPEGSPELQEIILYIQSLRQIMAAFSSGNIDEPVEIRGYLGGHLKALQANLRHLTWQAHMVAKGDLRQRVSFMGEFSTAFNEMVIQLEQNMQEIASSRDKLAQMNSALLRRIKRKEIDEDNLRRSEMHFKHLAFTDQLTNTLTRHHFFVVGAMELTNIINHHEKLCLIMIDADYFKSVNDSYGHLAGDEVLKGLAERFQTLLRDRDMLARYGGEEFVIVLPQVDKELGLGIAERLRENVAQKPIATREGDIPITISLGLVYLSGEERFEYDINNAEGILLSMINQADIALYQAKHNGRNQVAFGGPENGDFSKISLPS